MRFHDDELYSPKQAAAVLPVAPQTLANWRCHYKKTGQRLGPEFFRLGGRIFYRGRALREWLENAEAAA